MIAGGTLYDQIAHHAVPHRRPLRDDADVGASQDTDLVEKRQCVHPESPGNRSDRTDDSEQDQTADNREMLKSWS